MLCFSLHLKPKSMSLSFRLLNGKFCICMKCCNKTKEYFYYWYQSQSRCPANVPMRKADVVLKPCESEAPL